MDTIRTASEKDARHPLVLPKVPWRVGQDSTPNDREDVEEPEPDLAGVVREEQEYLRERLRTELGREPSEDELNEWLREHTESY
ncbi:MAG: hypothetical protein QOH96_3517 [Blastocatellia bacterium]|jgi:hypothetical protein|nr:hypothetical protein [Blastocatellia bacterium]